MIKRRFYRLDHGDKNEPSSGSSSSSDSDVEAEASENSDHDDAVAEEADPQDGTRTTSSGISSPYIAISRYFDEPKDDESGEDEQNPLSHHLSGRRFSKPINQKESGPDDMPDCVLQFKSVYRCRICPRIICLTEQTMSVHLKSKRHARSEKQLKENRLKEALNSDGEIENQETAAEMNARVIAIANYI
ncbi:hypothetical protein LINPERHAP1_LOCUS40127 [Linum perenne]